LKTNQTNQTNELSIVSQETSKRRFLKGLAAVMGTGAVAQLTSGNALAVAFDYKPQKDSAKKAGRLFSQVQMAMLADICEVILPKTDTPSAAELDVHGFIDHQLVTCYDKAIQQHGKDILAKIDQQSQTHFSKSFTELSTEQQTKLLVAIEQQDLAFTADDKQQFKGLKLLVVFGYFTTEVGATQALSYQAVPGGFKGSIPYDSIGKSYGSLAYY